MIKNYNLEYYSEEKILEPPFHVKDELDFLFRIINSYHIKKLVDFGSGGGRLTIPLLLKNYKVEAIDIDKKAQKKLLKIAKKIKKDKNLKIYSQLPKDKKYNLIVGADILHHIDIKKYFSLFYQSLRRKGKIVFSEPNILNVAWIVFISLFLDWKQEKGIFLINYFNLINQLKKSGFKNIKIFGLFLFPPMIFSKFRLLNKLNFYLGNLPILKFFAFRFVVVARK